MEDVHALENHGMPVYNTSFSSFTVVANVNINRPCSKKDPAPNVECEMAVMSVLEGYRAKLSEYQRSGWDMEVLENTFNKFKTHVYNVNQCAWTAASDVMRHEYRYVPRRIVDFHEIKKPVDKSPGWPGINFASTIEEWRELNPHRAISLWAEMSKRPVFTGAYAFIKDEPIKVEKIKTKDQRLILCWDDSFQLCKLRFQYDDHMIMKRNWMQSESKMGWSPLIGGLHDSIAPLLSYRYKLQEDFKRFDGTICEELMLEVYSMDWDNLSYEHKTEDNNMRYYNIVHNSIHTHEILPNGDVVRLAHGNKSGTSDTTPLNAKVNTFLKAYEMAAFLLSQGESAEEILDYTYHDWRQLYTMITYGDDRLVGEDLEIPLEFKENIYKELGMWLPKDKIKRQDYVEGLSFCGAVIKRDPCTKRYYPCFGDNDKLIDSFVWKNADFEEKLLNYVLISYGGKYHTSFLKMAEMNGVHVPDPQDIRSLIVGW